MVETEDGATSSALALELRRGALTLAVLGQLRQPHYGYSLRHALAACGLTIDEGTLYPLLRRLESQGLLDSEWRLEGTRPRRYYQMNPTGRATLDALVAGWRDLAAAIERALEEVPDVKNTAQSDT